MTELDGLKLAADQLIVRIAAIRAVNPTPILLIDGRAGSGKSTLTKLLENRAYQEFEQAPHVIHMDDIYPGWDGLRAGSSYLLQAVLTPLKTKGVTEWQVWDWERGFRGADDPGNGWRSFSGGNLLIIEGCGSISRQSAEHVDLRVWVQAQEYARRARFRYRDAGQFFEHWGLWSAQEDDFYESECSRSLCEVVVEN